jgi:methylmalonyl-CoA/ethylmalonyl-CoA epimerase
MDARSALAPQVLAVDHAGVAVAELEPAIAFYTEVLGLELRQVEQNADQGVVEAMLAAPGSPPEATKVQLVAPLSSGSALARFLDRRGPGLQHLALRVADVESATRALRDRGLRLLYDSARGGTGGTLINFVHPKDAGGVLVELVQVPRPVREA